MKYAIPFLVAVALVVEEALMAGSFAVRDFMVRNPISVHPWQPVAAVLGHIFSPFVGFRGGKGVATAAGIFVALAPVAVLIALPVWGLCLWLSGYVSLSSILAAGTLPLWVKLTRPGALPAFWASVALALLILYSHRANIRRLLAGTENRFGARKASA